MLIDVLDFAQRFSWLFFFCEIIKLLRATLLYSV